MGIVIGDQRSRLPTADREPDTSPGCPQASKSFSLARGNSGAHLVLPTWANFGFTDGHAFPGSPPDHVEAELTIAQSGHNKPAPLVGRVGLVVTPPAERHQLVEVEVGAAPWERLASEALSLATRRAIASSGECTRIPEAFRKVTGSTPDARGAIGT